MNNKQVKCKKDNCDRNVVRNGDLCLKHLKENMSASVKDWQPKDVKHGANIDFQRRKK